MDFGFVNYEAQKKIRKKGKCDTYCYHDKSDPNYRLHEYATEIQRTHHLVFSLHCSLWLLSVV